MHIAINCRSFLSKHFTGIGRYASNLVDSLSRIDQENQYSLYVAKSLFNTKRRIPKVDASNFSVKVDWFHRGVGKILKHVDVYHSPSPDVIDFNHAKIVVTIHDLVYKAFPEGHTEETLRLTDQQIHSFLPKVSKIICSSQNTLNDVHRFFQIDDGKTVLVYQGIDKQVFYQIGEDEKQRAKQRIQSLGIKDPFILFIGTIEPRKNLKNILKAFSILKGRKLFKGKLVVIGMMGWKSEGFSEQIANLGIEHDVILPGFLSNDQLRSFYNLAEVFVFPSFYEGFGYPIVEAFSCGTAVVTSNASSCPEIAQDAAVMVNPYDPDDIARSISRILDNQDLKNDLIQKGLKRAEDFDHLKTARETLDVYREVYKQ